MIQNMNYNRRTDYERLKQWRALKKRQGFIKLDMMVPKSLAIQLLKLKQQFKQEHPRIYQ